MFLKIVKVGEAQEASNGNKYKVVTFQELSEYMKLPGLGEIEVKSNAKPASRTLWEGQDGLFDGVVTGNVTFGSIKRYDVEKYNITDAAGVERSVDTFTGVQFRGETDETTCRRYNKVLRTSTTPVNEEAKTNAKVVEEAVEAREITA